MPRTKYTYFQYKFAMESARLKHLYLDHLSFQLFHADQSL